MSAATSTPSPNPTPPKFTIDPETGTHVITEAALKAYAASLSAVVAPTPGPFPTPLPNALVSPLSDSPTQYVYIGVHHTLFNINPPPAQHLPTAPLSSPSVPAPATPTTPYTILRGPALSATGREKLNSIFREGIRPALNAHRALLYGPGVYLTQRPAAGNLAAAGGLLGLTAEQLEGELWDIVQIHVFVPYDEYRRWRVQEVKLIPDCDAFHADEAIREIRSAEGLRNDERESWGLGEEDVVVTLPRSGGPHGEGEGGDGGGEGETTPTPSPSLIEELVLSQSCLAHAKLLAQVLPNRELFLPYMAYRRVHRYRERAAGEGEWSELAIRVLENGDADGGVERIRDAATYVHLRPHVAGFKELRRKEAGGRGGRYWRELERFRERL